MTGRRNYDDRPAPQPLGSIRADELVPLRVFCARLGIGRKAWSALARRGCPVIRAGKQVFLDGAAVLDFFRRIGSMEGEA